MPERVFNPDASVRVEGFDRRHFCLIIDDALLEPERVAQYAVDRRADFSAVDSNFYPGVHLVAPRELTAGLAGLFQLRVRRRFDARRCVDVLCRYSMVTLAPQALQPIQWMCHRDDSGLGDRLSMQASVLYLFRDPGLGGTSFYAPTRPRAVIAALFRDASQLPAEAFIAKYGIKAEYIQEGNDYFKRIGNVPAVWNRLIFYDGGMFHSSDITAPHRLTNDPFNGRLTLNGFFTCRRNLA